MPAADLASDERVERPAVPAPLARAAAVAVPTESAEALQARQMRHVLLRDFDRTPLTLANFCALKGLKPEALAPMLELARKEVAAAPPVPAHPIGDRGGPSGPWRDDRRDDRRAGRPGDRPRQGQETRGGPRPDPRRPRGPTGQS
jgi:hypothetical protein